MQSNTGRRLSTASVSSDDSTDSPHVSTFDSSSALILVHDADDSNSPFDVSDDDDDIDYDDDELVSPQFEVRKASIPPLPPSLVFLYLLGPYLKMGAMTLPYTSTELKYGLSELLGFAALAALARQIWYKLARYIRKADMEDLILDTFARKRGKERQREILRILVRAGTGSISVLLATVYLRESASTVLSLLPPQLQMPFTSPIVLITLALCVLTLSSSKSLASKRIVYCSWLSIITFLVWLGCVTYSHSQGTLFLDSDRLGNFWQGISTITFAYTSSSTLPLYASLKGTTHPVTTTKTSRSHSFRLLSTTSVLVGTLLMLPLVLFSAFSNQPETELPVTRISVAIASLKAATLLFGIPSILVTTPVLPIPERIRRTATFSVSKVATFFIVTSLSLLPHYVSGIMNDVLLFLVLSSTYFLPAIIHISAHFFKRPLSIVIPQLPGTPIIHTPSNSRSGAITSSPTPRAVHDELLRRKERALQKRQSRKRIVWDIGVWVLFGVSIAGIVGAVGRIMGRL